MKEINNAILLSQIRKIEPRTVPAKEGSTEKSSQVNFEDFLQNQEVQFSKHAERRLVHRKIELSEADKAQLNSAMGSLEQKGARDSLVLMGDLAFVVNVPSKTVVTALSKDQMKEQVFTNIDSTILI